MTRARRVVALLGLVGMFTGVVARGQSYPVYWDVGEDSYRWARNLIDFATETWVLVQGYVSASVVTNMIDEAMGDAARESLWHITSEGYLSPKAEPIDYGDHWALSDGDWGFLVTTTNVTADVLWRVNEYGDLVANYEVSP